MLSSISPLGERARRARWGLTVAAYLVGSIVGGVAAGTACALVGALVPATWRASTPAALAVAGAVVVGLVLDVRSRGGGPPSWRRQVDDAWLGRYRGWVYGLGFGVQLGAGVVTIVTSSTVYAVLLLAGWSGEVRVGVALGATFGLTRALPVLSVRGVRTPGDLRRLFGRVERWARPVDRVARGSLVVAALVVAGAGWS